MMIDPEMVHKELENKGEREIRREIRKYKREIKRLRALAEEPFREQIAPSYSLQLQLTREYLQQAIFVLLSKGYEYFPSKEEQKREKFNEKLEGLTKIEFWEGGFCCTCTRYLLEFDQTDKVKCSSCYGWSDDYEFENKVTKTDCIESLQNLYISEWKKRYFAPVLDGTQWELSLFFKNGRKKCYYGSNAFPFGYEELKELFETWVVPT